MSAADIDAAMATAVETLFGAGTYRQQSDVRQNRERVDSVNAAYQLLVEETTENPARGSNRSVRVYLISTTVKKYVGDPPDEIAWRLGGMATGREAMLSVDFYLGLGVTPGLVVESGSPQVTEAAEVIGRTMRFTVQTTVEQPY